MTKPVHCMTKPVHFIVPKLEELIFPFIWYWKFVVPVLNALTIGKANTEADKSLGQLHRELNKRPTQPRYTKNGIY